MRRRTFILAGAASVVAAADDGPLEIRVGGRAATNLYAGGAWDKPFLYPIRTVSGIVLSRGWPIDERPGDSMDHTWHRGFGPPVLDVDDRPHRHPRIARQPQRASPVNRFIRDTRAKAAARLSCRHDLAPLIRPDRSPHGTAAVF